MKSNKVVSISEGGTKEYTQLKDKFEAAGKLIFNKNALPVNPRIPSGGSLTFKLEDKALGGNLRLKRYYKSQDREFLQVVQL